MDHGIANYHLQILMQMRDAGNVVQGRLIMSLYAAIRKSKSKTCWIFFWFAEDNQGRLVFLFFLHVSFALFIILWH